MTFFEPGTYIGRHRVLRLLGTGTVGAVYEVLAEDGALRALKLVQKDTSQASKDQARLCQEGGAMAVLDHPNVVRFYDAGMVGERVWILLELVEGPDLRVLLEREGGSLPVARAVRILRGACEGVAAAHREGILHRDLKPENILVAAGDTAKVADFGSALVVGKGLQTSNVVNLGSYLYLAHEILSGKRANAWSDVYVMGTILYEALAGKHPFGTRSMSMGEILARHLTHRPPPLASLGIGVSEDLSALVDRAIARVPTQRCSMRELADGLAAELFKLDAPRRAAARALPAASLDPYLAKTEPAMTAYASGGTIPMSAFTGPPSPGPAFSAASPSPSDRSALLPPAAPPSAPRAAPWVGPGTLRSAGSVPAAPVAAVAPADRASSAVPVERPATRSNAGGRGSHRAAGVAAAGAVLLVGVLGAGWLWFGSRGGAAAIAPSSPAASATAPVVVAPAPAPVVSSSASAASSAPKPPATPGRPSRSGVRRDGRGVTSP